MHIPDGFLTNRVAVSLDAISGASILFAARRVKLDFSGHVIPLMGVLAAFVFAAQMLNFPVLGGTSGHLIGGSLLAILLGPTTGFMTMATVVFAQALFLQDGGLVALGANIFNISAVACFGGYAVYRLLNLSAGGGRRMLVAGFLAGWVSVMLSALFCALELGLSGAIPLKIGLTTMLGYHAVVGVVEGMLTAGVLSFLLKVRPGLMEVNKPGGFGMTDWIWAILFVAIPASILLLAGGSALPDSLEKMLALSPLSAEGGTDFQKLSSTTRYMDYLIGAAAFVFLLGLGILAARFARHKGKRP
jgi:cobalt/nickel transport system permease protein